MKKKEEEDLSPLVMPDCVGHSKIQSNEIA